MGKSSDDNPCKPILRASTLLGIWDHDSTKQQSTKNKANRLFANDMHTMGPTSYAFWREKLKQEDPNKAEPSKSKVYFSSRKRNPEKSYKTSFTLTKQMVDEMEVIQSQGNEGSNFDPYDEVMKKPEHSGRMRLYGKGVTMTDLKKGGKSLDYIFPPQYLQSMQSQLLDQVLQANPELQKLLEANPGVKIVLPSMSRGASNGKSPGTESIGHISMGAHSNNQAVHDEANNLEMENVVDEHTS